MVSLRRTDISKSSTNSIHITDQNGARGFNIKVEVTDQSFPFLSVAELKLNHIFLSKRTPRNSICHLNRTPSLIHRKLTPLLFILIDFYISLRDREGKKLGSPCSKFLITFQYYFLFQFFMFCFSLFRNIFFIFFFKFEDSN